MTQKDLKKLGFQKTDVSKEESGAEKYSYYSLDIAGLCLLSNEDMNNLYVEILESDVVINDIEDLTSLIEIFERCQL